MRNKQTSVAPLDFNHPKHSKHSQLLEKSKQAMLQRSAINSAASIPKYGDDDENIYIVTGDNPGRQNQTTKTSQTARSQTTFIFRFPDEILIFFF